METNVSPRRSFLATHSIVLANSPPSKAREISPILGNHCYFVCWLLDMVCLIMTNTKVELSMYSKLTRQTPCNQLRLSSHSYAQFDPALPQESRKGQWASVMLAWKRCITTQSSPCDLRGSAKEQPCHGFLKFGGCHMSWADSVRTTHAGIRSGCGSKMLLSICNSFRPASQQVFKDQFFRWCDGRNLSIVIMVLQATTS